MFESVLSFLGGVGNFASYVTDYFKEKGIKDTQKRIDELQNSLENCIHSRDELVKKCEQDKMLIKTKYDQKIDELIGEIDVVNPKVGGRVIEG